MRRRSTAAAGTFVPSVVQHMRRAQSHSPSSDATASQPVVAPLPVMPVFHPKPFRQDKFLSIKSRSAETFIESRHDILARSAKLRDSIAALSQSHNRRGEERTGDNGEGTTASRDSDGSDDALLADLQQLLPSHIEEMASIQAKLIRLEGMQGFVLTDELVYRAFHDAVANGAFKAALQHWLLPRILAEGESRGPVFPLFVLEDLVTVLSAYLERVLPDGEASVMMLSALPPPPPRMTAPASSHPNSPLPSLLHPSVSVTQQRKAATWARAVLSGQISPASTAAEGGARPSSEMRSSDRDAEALDVAKRAFMESVAMAFPPVQASSPPPHHHQTMHHPRAPRYVQHQLNEYVAPLLAGANALGLLFTEAPPMALHEPGDEDADDADDEGSNSNAAPNVGPADGPRAVWMANPNTQRVAVRQLLRRFTSKHSFLHRSDESRDTGKRESSRKDESAAAAVSLTSLDLRAGRQAQSGAEETASQHQRGSGSMSDGQATLMHVMQWYASLARCAAEVRADELLLSLFAAFVRGFVCTRAEAGMSGDAVSLTGAGTELSQVALNTHVWVAELSHLGDGATDGTAAATVQADISQFAVDFLTTVFYGRQAALADTLLWQTHDVLQLLEALRVSVTTNPTDQVGRWDASRAIADGELEQCAMRLAQEAATRASVLGSVSALVSAEATASQGLEDRVLAENLPAVLSRVLGASGDADVTSDGGDATQHTAVAALWADAACIATGLLQSLTDPSASTASLSAVIADAAGAVEVARLYVGVASNDVERITALHDRGVLCERSGAADDDDATGAPGFTREEMQTIVEVGIARRQAQREVHALLALLHHRDGPSTETRSLHEEPLPPLAVLARVSSESAAATAESRRQMVDGALDSLTATTLTAALRLLRRCYELSAAPSDPATVAAPPGHGDAFSQGDGDDSSNWREVRPNEEEEEEGVAAARGATREGDEQGDETASPAEERAVRGSLSVDPPRFTEAYQTEAGPVLRELRANMESFLSAVASSSLTAAGQEEKGSADSCLTPAAAARLGALYGPLSASSSSSCQETQAFHEQLWRCAVGGREGKGIPEANAAAASPALSPPMPAAFGNAYGLLLLTLARAGQWALAEKVLEQMAPSADALSAPLAGTTTLSSVAIEADMFAEVFQRARDAGESNVCLLLRQSRERLFYA